MGVLISLEAPSGKMKTDAVSAGFYQSPGWRTQHPRLQILTVAELLDGKRIDMPPIRHTNVTFRQGARAKVPVDGEQGEIFKKKEPA
jgi:site-specific DNA-methyltransferase (adenine-specific)